MKARACMQMTSGRALGVRRARPHATSDTAVVWHVSKMHERVKPAARLWDVAVGLWMACTGCDMNVSWVVWPACEVLHSDRVQSGNTCYGTNKYTVPTRMQCVGLGTWWLLLHWAHVQHRVLAGHSPQYHRNSSQVTPMNVSDNTTKYTISGCTCTWSRRQVPDLCNCKRVFS